MKYSGAIITAAVLLTNGFSVSNQPASSSNTFVQGEDRVYTEAQVTEKATILERPNPRFPQQLWNCSSWPKRRKSTTLGVKLKVVLLKSGVVGEVEVIKGRPCGTTESSIDAARSIKFKPAVKNGAAVSQYLITTYYFIR